MAAQDFDTNAASRNIDCLFHLDRDFDAARMAASSAASSAVPLLR